MPGRVAQRYLVAVVAFAIAAAVTGLALVASLECLAVFSGVYVAGAAYQQRALARQRQARPRRRRPAVQYEDAGEWTHAVDWPSAL